MPPFNRIISDLRKQERRFAALLAGIRAAISSLEIGGGRGPAAAVIEPSRAAPRKLKKRRRRKMSAAARKAVSERMTKYWAARRKAKH